MPAGDALSIMPSLKQLHKTTGKKIVFQQRVNLGYTDLGGAYIGATYSIKNEAGVPVTMNNAVFKALRPLMMAQEYIEDFIEWDGQPCEYDFDRIRYQDTTMYMGCINRWPFYIWPEMTCDLSKSWLSAPRETVVAAPEIKILINRTERYNNMLVSYNFLRHYSENVAFIGLPEEHEILCQNHRLNIKRLDCADFLEIAAALKSCKLFIGNQSAVMQVAEGIKCDRVLEVCKQMPNVIGSGYGFYDFLNQDSLEYHINKLFNS